MASLFPVRSKRTQMQNRLPFFRVLDFCIFLYIEMAVCTLGPCFNLLPGLEMVDLERTEKWFFCGFLLCHFVVNINRREAGEFRIWSMLFQGLWVIPVFRYDCTFFSMYFLSGPFYTIQIISYHGKVN